MAKNILIIGGGFTGLTAAYKLSRESDFSITLVESSGHLGGLAAGFPLLGTNLEMTYHHLFLTDTVILDLVRELGLSDKLMWCESSVGIYLGGRVHPFMSPLDLLRFKPCSLTGRLRFWPDGALPAKEKKLARIRRPNRGGMARARVRRRCHANHLDAAPERQV